MNGKGSTHMIAHILLLALVASLAVLLLMLLQVKSAAPATLPASFEDRLLTSINKPIALAFTPDGRMLVATQPGQLRVYKNGQLLQTPALDISSKLCTNSERGLLGVAVDPNFSTNK
jgi:glucose/arabinose dehydrogenase